jgi:hypothetical protein
MHQLRKRLQSMTDTGDPSRHSELLDAIALECPHTIRILNSPLPLARYTCLVFALGFAGREDYETIASRGFNVVFAGRGFAHWLLDQNALVEMQETDVRRGELVSYFDDGRFMHAGLFLGNHRVASKWGVGHLYEHPLWEVPESYGTTIRFFKRLSCDEAMDYFIRFAKDKGMLL